jgi:hypothetical protein
MVKGDPSMRSFLLLLIIQLITVTAYARQSFAQDAKPIQDNSFLLEEAYNQERGVVQHINTFQFSHAGDWVYTFTQEWPVPDQKHQLSFTLPVLRVEGNSGIGDMALNYRYQLVGNGDARVAMAPRFSLLLPTGDSEKELGAGGVGLQFNIPVSVVLHPKLVTHWNAGVTYTPTAKNADGVQDNTTNFNLGQSFIWLVHQNFNVLFETVWNSVESIESRGVKTRSSTLFVNPAIRWAHNFRSGLQIVPGMAFPVGIGPSSGDWGVFFYLSFEHPLF